MYIFGSFQSEENTLANFMDQSAFDEKFIVNIEQDAIQNIYHIEGKYYVPLLTGVFSEMYDYAVSNMVHSDDYESFRAFMNPKDMLERLSLSSETGVLKTECRQRLMDGTFRWVQYCAISGIFNGVPDGCIFFYVFDIQNQKDRLNGKTPKSFEKNYRNALTGLYLSEEFIPRIEKMINKYEREMALVAIDIQHFKIFNAWFGHEKGDYVLAKIGSILLKFENEENAIASYYGRDNFSILMENDEKKIQKLYQQIKEVVFAYSRTIGFLPAIGVYILDLNTSQYFDAYDNARMAVEDAKKSYTDRIRYFDDNSYSKKMDEYIMVTDFQNALQNGEIQFFLQPQCMLNNGKIVGAEALARWIRKDGSIVSPGAFIPFLENNGFITDLDKCIWEGVCKFIRSLIDQGIRPVPISINVSKVDILSMDVSSYLYGLVEKYNIPTRLLKVEITESVYSENYDVIENELTRLKEKNFTVLMDDFGSGYSSLNMLDKVSVDTIKLDMGFMPRDTSFSKKGVSIVESIINLTKMLNIPIIVEGVENKEQVHFLDNLGCLYAQGYYFYKPMSISSFTQLIMNDDLVEEIDIHVQNTEMFHAREFLDENLFPDNLLNEILGPVALYVLDENKMLNIVRYNKQFYNCIADLKMDERVNGIQDYIVDEDHTNFYRMLDNATNDPVNGGECTVRFKKSNDGEFWYHMHLYYIRNSSQGKLYYGKVADATEMHEQGMAFYELCKQNAYSCMRIDLNNELIFELDKYKPFDDPTARNMDVFKCLRITADVHIQDEKKREEFVEFFHPNRLKESLKSGIYYESFETKFSFSDGIQDAIFNAYYIKFIPNQEDNVYVFINRKR